MTAAVRAPRSLTEAQRLCERWAEVEGQIAAIEDRRTATIAAANAAADQELAPLVAQRGAIAGKLEIWWGENAALLTQGKRKSAELGGAVLGTREGKASVVLSKPVADTIFALRKIDPSGLLVRTTVELDKAAVGRALLGERAGELNALGLSLKPGRTSFYIQRTGQAGTLGKAG